MRTKNLSVFVLVGLSTLSAIVPLASAQTSAATINGSVHDESDAPIPNVDVIVENQGTGVKTTVTTNSAGDFTVTGLAVGTYEVAASKQGFQPFQTAGAFLGAAQTLTVNAVLKVARWRRK
jgi:hypothetical protein